jgi:hypothetical protein
MIMSEFNELYESVMNEGKEIIVKPVKGEYGKVTVLKQMKKDGMFDDDLLGGVKQYGRTTIRKKRGKDIIFQLGFNGETKYILKYPTDWEEPTPINKPSEIARLLK